MEVVRFAKLFDHSIVRPDATHAEVARFVVFMINQLPNSSDASTKFFTLVYQALVKG